MLTLPKRISPLRLTTLGTAAFSIGLIGSLTVLTYLHPGRSNAPTTSNVVSSSTAKPAAKSPVTVTTSGSASGSSQSGTTTSGTASQNSGWQTTLPVPASPQTTYRPQASSPAPAAAAPVASAPAPVSSSLSAGTSVNTAPLLSPASTTPGGGGTTSSAPSSSTPTSSGSSSGSGALSLGISPTISVPLSTTVPLLK